MTACAAKLIVLGITFERLGVFLLLGEAVILGGNLNIAQLNQVSLGMGFASLVLLALGFILLIVG